MNQININEPKKRGTAIAGGVLSLISSLAFFIVSAVFTYLFLVISAFAGINEEITFLIVMVNLTYYISFFGCILSVFNFVLSILSLVFAKKSIRSYKSKGICSIINSVLNFSLIAVSFIHIISLIMLVVEASEPNDDMLLVATLLLSEILLCALFFISSILYIVAYAKNQKIYKANKNSQVLENTTQPTEQKTETPKLEATENEQPVVIQDSEVIVSKPQE